jgi:hypothetical protein
MFNTMTVSWYCCVRYVESPTLLLHQKSNVVREYRTVIIEQKFIVNILFSIFMTLNLLHSLSALFHSGQGRVIPEVKT